MAEAERTKGEGTWSKLSQWAKEPGIEYKRIYSLAGDTNFGAIDSKGFPAWRQKKYNYWSIRKKWNWQREKREGQERKDVKWRHRTSCAPAIKSSKLLFQADTAASLPSGYVGHSWIVKTINSTFALAELGCLFGLLPHISTKNNLCQFLTIGIGLSSPMGMPVCIRNL